MSDPTSKTSQKSTEDSTDDDPSFKKPKNRKRKKKGMEKTDNKKVNDNKTPEREIPHMEPQKKIQDNDEILHMETETINTTQIASTSKGPHTRQDGLQAGSHTNTNIKTNIKNYSTRMLEISKAEYKHLFYLAVDENLITDRIKMADEWNKKFPNSTDIVIKTKLGYLIKSNNEKEKLIKVLEEMKNEKVISGHKETKPYIQGKVRTEPQQSFSVIITGVEKNIKDEEISQHLNELNLKHRFCRRITSRAFNTPTTYIRIITGEATTSEKLLNDGLFFKNRHYLVYTSHPPEPMPVPCSKCCQFDHITEKCTQQVKCNKCNGNHKTTQCKTNLAPKCSACGSEEHLAWSTKCPKHPKKPIEGIPNVTIRTLNKKTREIEDLHKKSNRIHAPLTIHDDIINTYTRKLNKPKNTNRDELLDKLKRRFLSQYKIDTTAVFSGNRIYILMFDVEDPNEPSPTEPVDNNINRQVQLEN